MFALEVTPIDDEMRNPGIRTLTLQRGSPKCRDRSEVAPEPDEQPKENTMSNFSAAIQYVLDNEGGFSNDPADSAGATRYGITHAEASAHGFDVDTLTLEQAKSIYEVEYWKFDGIGDQRVATKLFDMCVNMGEATAIRMAQTAVGVPADGVMGPATAQAINAKNPMLVLWALLPACVKHYADIVSAHPSQVVFLRGWMDRALSLPT